MENLLVSIASFKKLHIGDFVKEKFELEGIECFLTDEGFEITDDNVPKGFKLKVGLGLKDTEKAIKILLQIHKEYDLDKIKQDSSLIKDKKNNIDIISFSSPRQTLFYKIFHPNKLKKMVSTSKIPMLVFPV